MNPKGLGFRYMSRREIRRDIYVAKYDETYTRFFQQSIRTNDLVVKASRRESGTVWRHVFDS